MDSNSFDSVDYLILASITQGVTKYTSIFKNCKKTNVSKFRDHVNKLEDVNLITIDKSDNWFTRNTNPSIILKDEGKRFVKEHSTKINQEWELFKVKNVR